MMLRRGWFALCYCTWVSLVLGIQARAEDNLLGMPNKAVQNKGTLFICGGGGMPDQVYEEFIKHSGGPEARVVLIPSATSFQDLSEVRSRYSNWESYKLSSLHYLDARSREEADNDEFLAPLEQASGVWMTGGYQGRLVDLYRGTKVEQALLRVLERGGVIGGTSAGAAVMSQVMIRYGSTTEAVVDNGFGLLQRAVVDQHFTQRGRHTRLLNVLEKHPDQIGLGIDERTALVVQGSHVRVLGESKVTVCYSPPKSGALLLQRLSPGDECEFVPPADNPSGSMLRPTTSKPSATVGR